MEVNTNFLKDGNSECKLNKSTRLRRAENMRKVRDELKKKENERKTTNTREYSGEDIGEVEINPITRLEKEKRKPSEYKKMA